LEQFIPLKQEYDLILSNKRDSWCWSKSYNLQFAKFKNELIGVLCSELAQGEEINSACLSWNKRVDPRNYMKATAPITNRQIEEARKFVEENGYEESFDRRFANIDDIKASEILHMNMGVDKIKSVSVFDGVKSTTPTRHKRSEFKGIEEVSIEKFMSDILPTCTSVEAYLSNTHEGNLVSLTTANIKDSKPIFKWSNNYSWTFNGNLAGKSQIKDQVKDAGGNVSGIMRFSIIWNDAKDNNYDNSDLDAWCLEPNGSSIGYNSSFRRDRNPILFSPCGGQLDLDNTNPGTKIAIENIYYKTDSRLKNGEYMFWVKQFSSRNSRGFKAEIEVNGEIYNYEFNKPLSDRQTVAVVTYKDGNFTIKHHLPESQTTKELYGLKSEEFHKVNLVCLSPNHWDNNNIGNKHYFFMLENCKCPTKIRSFHVENLISDLLEHRKVMEVLGNTAMIESTGKQLSGLGFNATVRDELVVKVQGSFKRTLKIKF